MSYKLMNTSIPRAPKIDYTYKIQIPTKYKYNEISYIYYAIIRMIGF